MTSIHTYFYYRLLTSSFLAFYSMMGHLRISYKIEMKKVEKSGLLKRVVVRPGCEHFSTVQEKKDINSADKNGGKMWSFVIAVVIS